MTGNSLEEPEPKRKPEGVQGVPIVITEDPERSAPTSAAKSSPGIQTFFEKPRISVPEGRTRDSETKTKEFGSQK